MGSICAEIADVRANAVGVGVVEVVVEGTGVVAVEVVGAACSCSSWEVVTVVEEVEVACLR